MSDKLDIEKFKALVFEVAKLIPKGRATSYGAIAKAIGYPNHSRWVGRVMGGCPSDVPAHRVVNSLGMLSGRETFGTPHRMQRLLEEESVIVVNNKISNWKSIFWNPIEEL